MRSVRPAIFMSLACYFCSRPWLPIRSNSQRPTHDTLALPRCLKGMSRSITSKNNRRCKYRILSCLEQYRCLCRTLALFRLAKLLMDRVTNKAVGSAVSRKGPIQFAARFTYPIRLQIRSRHAKAIWAVYIGFFSSTSSHYGLSWLQKRAGITSRHLGSNAQAQFTDPHVTRLTGTWRPSIRKDSL